MKSERREIANVGAEVVQATGNLHDHIRETRFDITKEVFDDPTAFDASNYMFNHTAVFGDQPIGDLVNEAEELSAHLFFGLDGQDPGGFIGLEPAIFRQSRPGRIVNRLQVGRLLIAGGPGIRLTKIAHLALGLVNNEDVFIRVGFFYHCNVDPVYQGF